MEAAGKNKAAAETAALQSRLSALTENLDRMYTDRLSGLLPETDFQRIFPRIKEERQRLAERIRELQPPKSPASQADRAAELVQSFLHTASTNRELLVSLIERIELTADRQLLIRFRFGPPRQAE